MVHFMSQLGQVVPRLNIIFRCVSVSLDEIGISVGGLSKVDALLDVGGPHPIH